MRAGATSKQATRALLGREQRRASAAGVSRWRARKTLTHLGKGGDARMVDVSGKPATERVAIAEGRVVMTREDARPRARGQRQEGRRARRRAHRRHHGGEEDPRADPALPSAADLARSPSTSSRTASCRACVVRATVKVTGQTGVEMEALTAVSVACLTIYDMVKAVERGMRIEGIRLIEKPGGQSGRYRAKE